MRSVCTTLGKMIVCSECTTLVKMMGVFRVYDFREDDGHWVPSVCTKFVVKEVELIKDSLINKLAT